MWWLNIFFMQQEINKTFSYLSNAYEIETTTSLVRGPVSKSRKNPSLFSRLTIKKLLITIKLMTDDVESGEPRRALETLTSNRELFAEAARLNTTYRVIREIPDSDEVIKLLWKNRIGKLYQSMPDELQLVLELAEDAKQKVDRLTEKGTKGNSLVVFSVSLSIFCFASSASSKTS